MPEPGRPFRLAEVGVLLRLAEARVAFDVDGTGSCVAVVDSGVRRSHRHFQRGTGQWNVVEGRDFSGPAAVSGSTEWSDTFGHGTLVGGIIGAGNGGLGIAPGATVMPVKVYRGDSDLDETKVVEALAWLVGEARARRVTCVCVAFGDGRGYASDSSAAMVLGNRAIQAPIEELAKLDVPVVAAAGNQWSLWGNRRTQRGMQFPAIVRSTISVASVYDADLPGPIVYRALGCMAFEPRRDRLTPYSQRIPTGDECETDFAAPGSRITATGCGSDTELRTDEGTSFAAPVVAGLVALLQQFARRKRATDALPAIADLVAWMRAGAVQLIDQDPPAGAKPYDDVKHTGGRFYRVDAVGALKAVP